MLGMQIVTIAGMMKKTYQLNLVVVSIFTLLVGCGKDVSLSVRPTESERNSPVLGLVRKIEVTYHDAEQHETVRESVSVLGLQTPVQISKDVLKDLQLQRGGRFDVNAFSEDQRLVMSGTRQLQEDEVSDVVEVELSHTQSESITRGLFLQRVRFEGIPMLAHFQQTSFPAIDRSRPIEVAAGSNHFNVQANCQAVNNFNLDSGRGSTPTMVLTSQVVGTQYRYRSNLLTGPGQYLEGVTELSASGEAVIRFDAQQIFSQLRDARTTFRLAVYSSSSLPEADGEFQACYDIELIRPALEFDAMAGVHNILPGPCSGVNCGANVEYQPDSNHVLFLAVGNPNPFPIEVEVSTFARPGTSGGAADYNDLLVPCVINPNNYGRLACGGDGVVQHAIISANRPSSAGVRVAKVFGVLFGNSPEFRLNPSFAYLLGRRPLRNHNFSAEFHYRARPHVQGENPFAWQPAPRPYYATTN